MNDLFAAADDILSRHEAPPVASGQRDGEFTKGLRAGVYGAGSQLNSLAGLAGEAAGFDEFAANRNTAAAGLRAQAQENAPRVGSYKQVDSLRSGADYLTGLIGSSLPVMGAGLAGGIATGGAGAIPAMLGAAAATAPFEIGDVVQKQREDPDAMKATAGSRLRDAALAGGASALAQGVVPGLVGRQVLGKAASSAAGQSVKSIVGRNALSIPGEGITEGAGEAIKQFGANQDAPLDWDAVKENAVGGAAAGGAFSAVGTAADLAHSRAGGVGSAIGSARTSINDRLEKAKTGPAEEGVGFAAEPAEPAVPKKIASLGDDLGALFQRGKAAMDDSVERVSSGQPLGDLAEFASAQGDRVKELMDFSDNETVKKAQAWAGDMLNDAGLTPERRQALTDSVQDITNPAARTAIAGMKKAWDVGQGALAKVKALQGSMPEFAPTEGTVPSAKKSEDYAGANKAIADQLTPLLARSQPALAEHPEAMAGLVDSVRRTVTVLPKNQLSSDTMFRLIDTLGADTAATLDAAYRSVGAEDPAKAENFYKNLNEIAELQQRSTKLQDLLGGALTEESQGLVKAGQLGELAHKLVGYARGDYANPNAGPHQRAADDRQFRALMAQHFGDKADAVSLAIEKEAGIRTKSEGQDNEAVLRLNDNGYEVEASEGGFDESGRRITAESLDSRQYGHNGSGRATVGGTPLMDPEIFMSTRQQGKNHARQLILDLQAKFPKHDVRFEKMDGSKDMGYVTVEKATDPDELSAHDLDSMRLDTKKYPDSKDRLEVNDMILDTKRIARVMHRKLEYTEVDEQSDAHRMARMFTEGVARITEHHGYFDVPDTAVIGKVGGKDFTYGEAQDLANETKKGSADDQDAQDLSEMRKRYAQATWSKERLAKAGLKREPLSREAMQLLKNEAKAYASRADFAKNRELSQDPGVPNTARGDAARKLDKARPDENGERRMKPFEEKDSRYDKDGNLTNDGAMALLQGDYHGGMDVNARSTHERDKTSFDEGQGRTDVSRDESIHLVAAVKGEGKMVNKVNMDGSPHSHNANDKTREDVGGLVLAIAGWKRGTAKAMGKRAEVLLQNFNAMEAADRRTFASLGGMPAVGKGRAIPAASASEAATTVNALARKYKDVIVAPGVKGESQMVEGASARLKAPQAAAPKTVAPKQVNTTGKGLLEKAVAKRQDYLDNPPEDYITEVARGHLDWAAKQKERVDAEYEKSKGGDVDRQDQLSDMRAALGRLMAKARAVIEADGVLVGRGLAEPEGAQRPKSQAAKKAALLAAASSSDPALLKELRTTDDAKGLQRAVGVLPAGKALDAANARMGALVQDRDVAYGLQTKRSAQATSAGTTQTINARAIVEAHITKVLGPSVKLAWANLTHAGEFERMRLSDVIRLSVHALAPMSTAHHESLHAFFAQLKDAGATDITRVLEKAAASEHVLAQLQARFANEPAVLAQLKDPEERAAYMYQMWAADPTFRVSIAAKTALQKIAAFIRSTLGLWSNDERALHIMDYFHSGQYAGQMASPSAVRAALMQTGTNAALETAKNLTRPLIRLADAVASTGSARLRETAIPALQDLADAIKREHTDAVGGDQGFIAAARIEGTKRRSALGEALAGYTAEHLNEARDALQNNTRAPSPEARLAVRAIKAHLAQTKAYMESAGVQLGDLGPDYFPRVWDTHYISKHQTEFKDMLEPYVRSGEFKGNVDDFIGQLTSRDGNEFGIESRMPGMQFKKERLLAFITPGDASTFVAKDLFGTLNNYITQATRRAEWNRRLGGGKLEALFDRAKHEGATDEDLKLADNYMKGVDGTLGDGINPHARRLMGNMIVYQNVRLLPLAIFSSIVDPVGILVRGGEVRDAWAAFKRGMADIPQSYGRKASSDEGVKLAELVGVIDSEVMAATLGDLYTQGMVGGVAQKINTAFFKYNLMEGFNRSFRVGATEAAVKFIARHADGAASAHSARWTGELGLRAGDVVPLAGGRIALTEADGLSAGQVTRVHAAINQWVDGAVLRPDAADKPVWMNDPHYALIAHLKQFVYSFQKTIIARVAHEFEHGNYTPAMALAGYVPVMIAADFAKGLLQGGGDQPEWKQGWDLGDYVGHGVQRAGLLGVGQFGFDAAEDVQRGGIGLGALVGPTVEQLSDAVQLLGGHKEFGPMVLNAMPANALYAHSLGGRDDPEPVVTK